MTLKDVIGGNQSIASGDHYTGDLFCAILHVNQNYWRNNEGLKHDLDSLINDYEETINSIIDSINKYRNTIKDI